MVSKYNIYCLEVFIFSTRWCFFLKHTNILMKQAKTWINAQRWFIGTEDTVISRFSTPLVLVTVFACSRSIFFFHCCWYSGEVVEGYLWLQITVSRRRTNQVCNYWFSKIFHILCHGFCCIFSVHLIPIAERVFPLRESQLSCTILQFFTVQSDTTTFDLID